MTHPLKLVPDSGQLRIAVGDVPPQRKEIAHGLAKTGWAVLSAAVVITGTNCSRADEPAPKAAPKPAAKEAEAESTEEKPAAEKKPVDPFAVRRGTTRKVLQLLLSRLPRPAKTRTEAGILEHLNKLEKVADVLLTRELEEETADSSGRHEDSIMGLLPQSATRRPRSGGPISWPKCRR